MDPMMNKLNNMMCNICNISLDKNNYESHLNGKKHMIRQKHYNRAHNSVFVYGVGKLTPEELKEIFGKYGEVFHILKQKDKTFATVQFMDESPIEKVLKAKICVGKLRFSIKRLDEWKEYNEKPKISTEHSDSTSIIPPDELKPGHVGVKELPVLLSDPSDNTGPQTVFEMHVDQFIKQTELSTDMCLQLNEVVSDIEEILKKVLPGCRVLIFGSCGTTLAFRNSDIDLFVQCVGDQPKEFVKKEANILYKSRQLRVITRIPKARVPIVKLIHIKTGYNCDLNAHTKQGVYNTRLIRFLICLDPRIRPLLMVVKYWAKVCGVTGSNQNLTSYSLVMLVIFYLQKLNPPILPSVATLQLLTDHKETLNGWECSFCDKPLKIKAEWSIEKNSQTLRELLSGFFLFYSTFDFNNVVCPLLGQEIHVSHFISMSLPKEMQLYEDRLKNDPKLVFKTNGILKVQDPFELFLNITKNVSDQSALNLQKACLVSFELAIDSDDCSLLKNLFSIEKESVNVHEKNFKIHIPFQHYEDNSSSTENLSESYLCQWYEQTIEAVLLILKEVLKFKIESNNMPVLSKVKKLEYSKDVHTSQKNVNSLHSYICSAFTPKRRLRKKVSKLLPYFNIHLSNLEREIWISNFNYKQPQENFQFFLNLAFSSLEQFLSTNKGIDVTIDLIKSLENKSISDLIFQMKYFFNFIGEAVKLVDKIKHQSSANEENNPLKKLSHLKLANLSDDSINLDLPVELDSILNKEIIRKNKKEVDDEILTQDNILRESQISKLFLDESKAISKSEIYRVSNEKEEQGVSKKLEKLPVTSTDLDLPVFPINKKDTQKDPKLVEHKDNSILKQQNLLLQGISRGNKVLEPSRQVTSSGSNNEKTSSKYNSSKSANSIEMQKKWYPTLFKHQ